MSKNGENMVNAKKSNLGWGKEDIQLPKLLLRKQMGWVTPEDLWPDKGNLLARWGQTWAKAKLSLVTDEEGDELTSDGRGLLCLFLETEALFVSVGNEESLPGAATACCREGARPCIAPW